MRLALKGRFQLILTMICGQSCLNMIAIESRKQGDYEELTNLLQNWLISSRFNQKFSMHRKNIVFIENFIAKITDRPIR